MASNQGVSETIIIRESQKHAYVVFQLVIALLSPVRFLRSELRRLVDLSLDPSIKLLSPGRNSTGSNLLR